MSALTECYARPGAPFGQLGPFYDALGHRGKDYYRGREQPIIAYDDMVIESIIHTTGLGWCVGLRRVNLGGFAGYAHIRALQAGIGYLIKKGGVIAYPAGAGDDPGSLWDGVHIHTTESWESAWAAAAGARPLTDPGPAIARATGSSTAGDGNYIPIGEDEMALADDLNWINQGVGNPQSLAALSKKIDKTLTELAASRADLNYVHQVSPYSLKAIRAAQAGGQPISLTPEQVEALSTQLVTGVTAGLGSALEEDQAAVLAAIHALPAATRAEITRALQD